MVILGMAYKTIFLPFSTRSVTVKEKIETPHLWFDNKNNKMWTFYGGPPKFEWNQKLKRTIPRVEWDDKKERWKCKDEIFRSKIKIETNEKDIRKWIKEIGKKVGAGINKEESNSKGIAINVENVNVQMLEHSLDRHRIEHEDL